MPGQGLLQFLGQLLSLLPVGLDFLPEGLIARRSHNGPGCGFWLPLNTRTPSPRTPSHCDGIGPCKWGLSMHSNSPSGRLLLLLRRGSLGSCWPRALSSRGRLPACISCDWSDLLDHSCRTWGGSQGRNRAKSMRKDQSSLRRGFFASSSPSPSTRSPSPGPACYSTHSRSGSV